MSRKSIYSPKWGMEVEIGQVEEQTTPKRQDGVGDDAEGVYRFFPHAQNWQMGNCPHRSLLQREGISWGESMAVRMVIGIPQTEEKTKANTETKWKS